ncbi:hypothetical protein LguiB_008613 [Lonicera macranthoides]
MSEQKAAVVSDVVSVMSKITEHKLNGSNYLDWSKTIRIYLRSIDKDDHMTSDPPSDNLRQTWLREDARLFLQIRNSIDSTVISLINHCELVKELMDYLDFLYSGKGNISRIYDVCKAFYRTEKQDRSIMSYFMDFKKTYEELNMLLPYSSDVKVQQSQREQMAIMSFLAGLPAEFETAKNQILSSPEISSLQEVYSRVLRTEGVSPVQTPLVPFNSALVSKNNESELGRLQYRGGNQGGGSNSNNFHTRAHDSGTSVTRGQGSGGIVCHYCHNPGHLKRDCRKLRYRTQRAHSAHMASTTDIAENSVLIPADEFAKYSKYQDSLKSSSTPVTSVTAIANSGKPNTCLVSSSSKWVIDSGATDHMTGNSSLFSTFQSHISPSSVTLADGTSSSVLGSGTITPTPVIPLSSVLHLPQLSFNLISVSQLTRKLNCCISFFPDYCLFQDLMTKKIIGKGHESGGLYILDTSIPKSVACSGVTSAFKAHCRLRHPSLPLLKELCPQFNKVSSLDCESCQFAKHHRSSLSPRVNKRASAPFELVHSDVWGPCPVMSKTGFKYFVTFVNDYSRTTWLYLMKSRSELFSHFCAFCAEIKTQFATSVHILRSDNAKEYLSSSFQTYMIQNGILHQTSCVDTPSQNGVAERKNRHLLETARALLFQMNVPKPFWADAVSTACFLINRMPSSVLHGETPYSVLFPNKSLFPIEPRIFGSICFVRDVRPQVTKLDPKSLKCVFLGYSRLQKGYRCYCPSLNKYLVSADVTFIEETPYFPSSTPSSQGEDDDLLVYTITFPEPVAEPAPVKPPIHQVYSRRRPADSCPPPASSSSSDSVPSNDLPIALRKGKRQCTYPVSSCVSYDHLSHSSYSFIAFLDSISVPKTVNEAISHPGWRNAMIEEMDALDKNGTWDLVTLPAGKQAIGCKWVFTVKVNPDGSVARLKARLVAKGYAQTYGVDYSDTFSPVAKLTSVRLFISLAATHHWPLHQLDIKNAFLHGDLQEEVYMEQPPGFVAQGEYGKVCHLRKSLYGLKQSPRAWFEKFSQAIETFGMAKSKSDHSVFYKQSEAGIILLVVYVDDIVITGSDTMGISSLKSFLHAQFHTKDLRMLKYFLGVEVTRSKKGIFLSQRKYVLDLLAETGKLGAKPCSTPMIPNVQLTKDGPLFEDPEKYRRLVGKLNYLTVTRPDIAYSVSVMSQFMSSPTIHHWEVLEQILCYLKGAPGRGILYANHGHTRIEGFSDADWAGSKVDRKSTSGYCIFVGGNLVSWKSKKQNVVARSSAESEYRAMAQSVCEIMWICQLLNEVGIKTSVPAKLWCDNQAAIHIASNPVFHERTKHIELDCHFVREKIQQGLISTGYVKTGEQLGDLFTKALNGVRVDYLCNKLGMINIYAPA